MSDTQRAIVPKIVPDDGPGRDRFIQAVSDHIMPRQKDFAWGDAELRLFLLKCDVYGLNPFKSQIYAVPFDGKLQFVVSIDGWRALAARTGQYMGSTEPQWCGPDGEWKDVWLEEGPPAAARIGVRRRGWEPVYAVARYSSYVRKNREGRPMRNWADMGDVMTAKCAEALALKKTFPDETAGLDLEGVGAVDGEARVIDAATGEITDSQASESPTIPARPAPRATNGRSTEVVTSWWELVDTVWSDLTKRQDRVDAANAWARERFGADFKDLDSAGTELALKALREWHESEGSQAEATDPDAEQSTLTI